MLGASILDCRGSGHHIVAFEKDSDIFNAYLKSMGDLAPLHSIRQLPPRDLDKPP